MYIFVSASTKTEKVAKVEVTEVERSTIRRWVRVGGCAGVGV